MKTKTIFNCQTCGHQSSRWMGKCPSCDNWNSFVEEQKFSSPQENRRGNLPQEKPVKLNQISLVEEIRMKTGLKEFDRVVGNGLMYDSVTLIGGDPGIGKSTLTLQIVLQLSAKGHKILYISGEESIKQTKMRANRLNFFNDDLLYIVNQINVEIIKEYIQHLKPEVVVIDSIQVIYHPDIHSSPGSVGQVRECAAILTQLAKSMGIALFLIGHVTKEGLLAGPRVLEHMVDTVLYFEGERYTAYRVLRTMKNRFGSTNEMGVFEMTAHGLMEVNNPSEIFLAERAKNASGSVVVPILEGTRPFLVEIQGLVSRSSFGVVRQKAQGFDSNRLALLVAVLEKRLGLNLQDKDIFLNVVGGVKVFDPAADLAVVLAIASAFLDKTISFDTVVIGEVGLSSEIRSVTQIAVRVNEAEKLGFQRCIVPKNNLTRKGDIKSKQVRIIPVDTVKEALDCV